MTSIDAYLERIGASRESTLAELQHRHLLSVPFENLSIHLGEEIELESRTPWSTRWSTAAGAVSATSSMVPSPRC